MIPFPFSDHGDQFSPLASQEDIFQCFRLILGRLPSSREWPGHSGRAGEPLAEVVTSYLNSLEFHNRGLMQPPQQRLALVELDGFAMYASPDDLAVGKPLLWLRDYEPHVSRLFKERLRPGMRVLDVGANIGFYSLLAASRVGTEGVVWAVEPNPANVSLILTSRRKNSFGNMHVVQAAAHDRWDTLCLFTDGSNGSVSLTSSDRPEAMRNTAMGLPLRAVLDGERVDLLKIDVEGAEGRAMLGMIEIIERFRPAVFSEFTPEAMPCMSGMTGEAYVRLFTERGYRAQVLGPAGVIDCGSSLGG